MSFPSAACASARSRSARARMAPCPRANGDTFPRATGSDRRGARACRDTCRTLAVPRQARAPGGGHARCRVHIRSRPTFPRPYPMKKSAFLPGLILLVASHVAMAQERIFDVHVHLWEGETSLQ